MSGTVRAGIVFGMGAVLAFTAGLFVPLPFINVLLAFGSMLILGWGAGYTAAKTADPGTGSGIGRGALAGLIAGGIVLVVATVVFVLLANTAAVRDAVADILQQNPNIVDTNTGEPASVDPVVATLIGGAGGGFCLGFINLVLLFIGGAIGGFFGNGVVSRGNTNTGAYDGNPRDPADGTARVYEQPK